MAGKIAICSSVLVFLFFLLLAPLSQISAHESETQEFVLTLDHSNFSDTVKKHNLIVVVFYAPRCDRSKKLAPEYEKAASILSSYDPAVVLAKIDADDEKNKDLATEFEVRAYPTIRILRNGGKNVQEYKGPREADGIAEYLKKQSGPASAEIKSVDDATAVIGENKVAIVGVFPKFSGEEFDNFTALSEKLRADYDFGHTLNAKHLPRGESSVAGPIVRLFKPFDELFVDFQDFHVEALEKFVEESSVPVVTVFNSELRNHPFIAKFFNSPNTKVMLFINFTAEGAETFKSKYRETAEQYRQPGVSFLVGDVRSTTGSFQYFGVREDQVPLILVQRNDGKKFLKPNLEPDQISTWFKAYKDGNIAPYFKSEPIPEANNEPVKVVVGDSLQDIVFNSGKNELAPTLEEVAVSYQSDADVIIAKLDGVANDISSDSFEAKRYPTVYFRSASGKISKYSGNRSKEDIIEFIEKNRDKHAHQEQAKGDKEKGKDEL
ncbi:hypothetical protein LR48_Vigan04g175700 [Vigna angularis]|uniref:protein disulfide-isomerase n=1 Tax=Phaseolus angularis TaxID=3914 RepID=A0A0L9UG89_PHAAN|nr:hypothetical protein LR48_Vigan04g175700 [Vigna angularis]